MAVLIFGMTIGFSIAILLGVCLSKWGHTHKLEPRSLTHMCETHHPGGGKTDITEVLYVCACGHAETREFTGSWKLADFQVTSTKGKDEELSHLRRMAGMEDSK